MLYTNIRNCDINDLSTYQTWTLSYGYWYRLSHFSGWTWTRQVPGEFSLHAWLRSGDLFHKNDLKYPVCAKHYSLPKPEVDVTNVLPSDVGWIILSVTQPWRSATKSIEHTHTHTHHSYNRYIENLTKSCIIEILKYIILGDRCMILYISLLDIISVIELPFIARFNTAITHNIIYRIYTNLMEIS